MPNKTNTELLEIILEQSKENAKKQLKLAADFSIFMNEHSLFKAEIRGYLESNDKTNQKGLVEQVTENTYDIQSIKTEKKVEKAKQTLLGVIVGSVLAFLGKLLF